MVLVVVVVAAMAAVTSERERFPLSPSPRSSPALHFIVLKRDRARVKHVADMIERHHLRDDAFLVPAIDGRTVQSPYTAWQRHFLTNATPPLRTGQIGCALSHLRLWQSFLEGGGGGGSRGRPRDRLVVFEDDALLVDGFRAKLMRFMQHLPEDVDIAQLLHHKGAKPRFRRSARTVNAYVKTGYPQSGLVGYVLSRKGARKLLAMCTPIVAPIDNMIAKNIRHGRVVSYVPTEVIVQMPYLLRSNIWTSKRHRWA